MNLAQRRKWRQRAMAILSSGVLLQVGACPFTGGNQLQADFLNFFAVAFGNLVTNSLSFAINNAVVRAIG